MAARLQRAPARCSAPAAPRRGVSRPRAVPRRETPVRRECARSPPPAAGAATAAPPREDASSDGSAEALLGALTANTPRKAYEPGWAEGEEPYELPRSIHDIDNGQILGYGADLAEDHPGFNDEEYKLAKAHVPGTPCPRVEYTAVEKATWSAVYDRLTALYPSHACERFNEAFAKFGFSREVVPQLADCADVIHRETGWTIRPTAGLLHPRDFLAGLAFKTFHSTQYVRHGSKPMYTPEPDVVHEILGHVPMLADPDFASLIHAIGVASLGASKRDLWHLTKVYWYTVEFGLIREADRSLKAFGAGVLSSYGELEYSLTPQPEIRELDPYVVMPKIDYSGGFQKTYFVLESFDEGAQLLKEFAGFISRPGVDEVQVPDVAVHGYADSAEQDWGTGAQRGSVKNGKDAQRAAAARGGSDWEE